jgi:hypothetical protein
VKEGKHESSPLIGGFDEGLALHFKKCRKEQKSLKSDILEENFLQVIMKKSNRLRARIFATAEVLKEVIPEIGVSHLLQ